MKPSNYTHAMCVHNQNFMLHSFVNEHNNGTKVSFLCDFVAISIDLRFFYVEFSQMCVQHNEKQYENGPLVAFKIYNEHDIFISHIRQE